MFIKVSFVNHPSLQKIVQYYKLYIYYCLAPKNAYENSTHRTLMIWCDYLYD